jgi:hypothetical protein
VRTRPVKCAARPEATGEQLVAPLIPAAQEQLRRLEERTKLSRTDLANRAITLYEFFDAQLREGRELVSRDNETGDTQLVRLVEAPAGQASTATASKHQAPARVHTLSRRLAGRHRSPRQYVRSARRRPAITGKFLPLFGLTGQEVRTQ